MHFGVFDYVTWARGKSENEVYQGELDLVRKAEEFGYEHYFNPEHHFLDFCLLPNQEVFISAAAAVTRKIQFVPFGFILNYRNPIRTAETIAMIDQISGGRMHYGITRGSVEWEYEQFGATWKEPERREIFEESYEVTLRALKDNPFSFHGKHFNYDNLVVLPRPFQKPYPQPWFPGTQSETSTKWAASRGMHTAAHYISNQSARSIFDMWKKYWVPSEVTKSPILSLDRHVIVGEDLEKTRREAVEPLLGFWQHIFSYRHYKGLETNLEWYRQSIEGANLKDETKAKPWEDFEFMDKNDLVIVGDPTTVARKILRAKEETGMNYFTSIFHFGSLSIERAAESMRLFAKKVIPLVNEAEAN
ncbi:MAG: LLM class flavin-dependent oxidoreductase [Nitrososphaerota archaeon]|nr:LLM class flavin-dependent oxidoreductase [Nitrososphaerota archaeon]